MISELAVVEGEGFDPYRNLALEKLLLERVRPSQCILYLWQNAHTVVIGRNQSALAEVRVAELEAAGGYLARRLSGGGAVYHDLGNLNFTFVCCHADYDVGRQTEVVLRAVRSLGIEAQRTGRNDLVAGAVRGAEAGGTAGSTAGGTAGSAAGGTAGGLAGGAALVPALGKFSGHAYYRSGSAPDAPCYHHGTLMVDVDKAALGRYLRPSAEKLRSKGVDSVRARVVNLAELRPGLSVAEVADALRVAFSAEYGLPLTQVDASVFAGGELDALTAGMASRSWLFRDERAFEHVARGRFPWGEVTLRYELGCDTGPGGAPYIAACALDSDGLEADFLAGAPQVLEGCPATVHAAEDALVQVAATDGQRAMAHDIAGLLAEALAAQGDRL